MPKIGELPTLWSKVVGIKCPECSRPQPPRKMDSTNPYRGFNRTDFHMCGGCERSSILPEKDVFSCFFCCALRHSWELPVWASGLLAVLKV